MVSIKNRKNVIVNLEFLLDSLSLVQSYVKDIDEESFIKGPIISDAVLYRMVSIGEAIKNLPEEMKEKYPIAPWHEAIGLRNIIAHDYLGIDLRIVYRTCKLELPKLESVIRKIIEDKN